MSLDYFFIKLIKISIARKLLIMIQKYSSLIETVPKGWIDQQALGILLIPL